MSLDINNFMEYATSQVLNIQNFIYNMFHPYQEKLNMGNIKNIYEPFIMNQLSQFINLHNQYKVPINDFLNKADKKYSDEILANLFDVNDFINFKIPTETFKFPQISNKNIAAYDYLPIIEISENLGLNKYFRSEYKSDNYYKNSDYQKVNRNINLLRNNLKPILKKKFNLNYTPSSAWVKLYEIMSMIPSLIPRNSNINTLSLAEAPGHFMKSIETFIHQRDIKYKTKTNYTWYANSLNPYSQIVRKRYPDFLIGDTFSLIRNYPKRWLWGKDNTGDIMNPDNIRHMKKFITDNNIKLDLVTSDAGLAGDDLFDLQKLEYAQAIGTIYLCSPNKHVVIKHFTPIIFEIKDSIDSTGYFISLMYLYALCFEKIYFTKPNSSNKKSGEFYLVGYKKKDVSNKLLDHYLDRLTKFEINQPLFYKKDIPEVFYQQVYQFLEKHIGSNNKFVSNQVYMLNCFKLKDNPELYKRGSCDNFTENKFKNMIDYKVKEWLKVYT